MTEVLLLSEEILSRDLNVVPCFWNGPTFKVVKYKALVPSRSFLKRLRHSFVKTISVIKDSENEDGFIFRRELTANLADMVFCIGSSTVYLRYLSFLNLYKQNNTEGMSKALERLKKEFERGLPELDIKPIVLNYVLLLKAQLLSGVSLKKWQYDILSL